MKLKKEIATLLLASTLLTASLTACQQTPDGGNEIDNTTSEITTPQTPPSEVPSSPFDEYQRDNYVLRESFINEQVGYTFVFDGAHFVALFKTTDGGKTWGQQTVNGAPDHNWNEDISCAKMLDENIGCIFVAHRADDCVSSRTHITTDGGKTWTQVILPPDGPYVTKPDSSEFATYAGSTAACDFFYENGKYIICFEQERGIFIRFQYSSTDLKNWTFEKSFDVSLSELEEKLGCYVSQEYGNNLEMSMRNDDAPFPIRFEYEEYKSTEFKIITQQGDDEFSITLPLKKPCRFLDWYSSFQDDLNGYVFVFDSNYASISAMPAIELVYLLKTTDGGKTWDVNQYQDPPSVGGRDYIEGAHFLTDQIGFFMARLCNVADLVDRTYWTFDGGNTWELMSPIQYPNLKTALGADKYNYSTEIADLELIDDTYYMTVIIVADGPYSFDGDYFLCVKYASKDLKNWTLEKSPDVSLERYIGTWYTSAIPPDDLTITSVSDDKIECQFGVYRLGLYDLTVVQEDGKFIFTDKNGLISGTMQFNRDSILLTIEESNGEYYQKGESWSFTIEDTIVRTIYSSSNSDGSDKVVCKYEYSKNGSKVYLQIDDWDQTLVLPFTYKYITEIKFAPMAATIIGDKGFFVHHPDNDGTSIEIFSFIKGSDEITEQTITWDTAICQSKIFCNFIDDETGYIFVTEEIDAPGFSRGAEKVAKLYKTHDGGKTWASVNCDNIPYISLRYSLMLAKFVTEDIGIIAGHLGPDDFNFHERTYITKDGGLSWIPVDLSSFADLFAYQVLDIEAYDLQYIDGTYYLYVEDRGETTPEGVGKPCYLFTSTDGVEWSYLKKVE